MKAFAFCALALSATFAAADINEIDNDKTHNVDCAKDKIVNLVGNNATVTLNGTCDAVNISGNDAKVTGSVKRVAISGNNNTLTLEAVDTIMVSGNENAITYKKPIAKKKTGVANSGNKNKIAKVK